MVGKQVQQYQFVEKLGAGGMGEIYKAHDNRLNRTVAIKVLPSSKSGDPERRRRFLHEAQAASSLNHPSIITIHDAISDGDTDYMVMEYVSGKTLNDLIPRGGLRVSQALKYALQITDALATAHAAGIIHRDLKPANIMVTDAGFVKILDFGLAKLTDRTSAFPDNTQTLGTPLTVEGAILGTVSYMSPEQAQGLKIDTRSDIFSCGAVLFEMVTGQRAFEGGSSLATLSAILRDETPSITQLAPDVPPQLEAVIQGCLRKNPDARWQSMRDVQAALAGLKRDSDSGSLYMQTVQMRPVGPASSLAPSPGSSSNITPPPLPGAGNSQMPSGRMAPPPLTGGPSSLGASPFNPQLPQFSQTGSPQSFHPPSLNPQAANPSSLTPPSLQQQTVNQQSFPGNSVSGNSMSGMVASPAPKSSSWTKPAVAAGGVLLVLLASGTYLMKKRAAAPAASVVPVTTPAPVPVVETPAAKVQDVMDNDDVLALMNAKVPVDLILNQIHSANETKFELGTDDIITLSKAGVPATVIEQMRNPKRPVTPSPATAVTNAVNTVNAITAAIRPLKQDKTPPVAANKPPAIPTPTATPIPVAIPQPTAPLVASAPAAPRAAETHTIVVNLTDALPFKMTLPAEIPAEADLGSPVRFVASEDFRQQGLVVIPKGAAILGEITETSKKKRFGMGGGRLSFKLTRAEAAGGQSVNVRALAAKRSDGPTQRQVEKGRTEYIGYVDGDQRINVVQK